MTRMPSTCFGQPLSVESAQLVADVRQRIVGNIRQPFDNDFNLYRFILAAERLHKNRNDIIHAATCALENHLRYRMALHLDEMPDMPFHENPLFKLRLMPCGQILESTDSQNRLLWYIEYASITVESIANTIQSTEACRYQFWQFEHMLRLVMAQEAKTGCLSSLRHVIDLRGYEINPFTMLFVSSGTLAYYSQLFHYENYPELVTPIDLVNISRWIHVPYRIARGMMPSGFNERFRLHDTNFLPKLLQDISIKDMPLSLGGTNPKIICKPAERVAPKDYWKPSELNKISSLKTLHLSSRKRQALHIDVEDIGTVISWYFRTDGDIYFGIFYRKNDSKELDIDTAPMIYPWLKLSAKLVHENDQLICNEAGIYSFVFCNRHSWFQSRTIDLCVETIDTSGARHEIPVSAI